MITRLLLLLYTIYASIVFLIFMFLCAPLITIPLLFKLHGNRLSFRGLHLWAQGFRLFSGIRYQIEGQEHLKDGRTYIFTPTHTSYLDAPALPLVAPGPFKTLAKKEIAAIPAFGWVARAVTEMVDRSNAESRRQSIERLTHALRSGTSLLVFPEGTINKTTAPLAPFYDGAFRIALETQTPVVPIVIRGASKLMPPGSSLMRPGKITVKILPPLMPSEEAGDTVETFKRQVYQLMAGEITHAVPLASQTKKDTAEAVSL
ncbi:lysophospholipid acyltransferase family protein [Nafulsella turpanensis]|uniref:lysophospholipid acyltransferase family protein n=1 Tax=Nafulsella turpanensis TaxID=1265690 RepID=UPI00038296C3|nr:lysophospholipid acyltransferase family protein [Nafulsella turpanensis]